MHILKRGYEVIFSEGFVSFSLKLLLWPINRYCLWLMALGAWGKAARIGEWLIKLFQKRLEYYHILARCYIALGEEDSATKVLRKGLEKNLLYSKIIGYLSETPGGYIPKATKYVYFGGEQNLGCIEQSVVIDGIVEKYLTKISTISGFEKEKLFYQSIYNSYPKIKGITPYLIDIKEIAEDNLVLIRMKKVMGIVPPLNKEMINKAINANKIITSIRYGAIKGDVPMEEKDGEFKLYYGKNRKHPICALQSFSSIHIENVNRQLFASIFKSMKAKGYTYKSIELIKRVESVIIGHRLFTKICPDVHYSLLHGDYGKQNMLVDYKDGNLYIIDWGNMRIGPTWVDIAGFFGQLMQPFHVVKDEFLFNDKVSSDFEPIEKLFFVYTLIVTWFIVFTKREFEENHYLYISPAVEAMEALKKEIISETKEKHLVLSM